MTAPRRLLFAVLLCCTVTTGLAACTPIDEDPTLAMASDDIGDPVDAEDLDDPADLAAPGDDEEDTLAATPDFFAPATLSPAPCTTHAGRRVVQVLAVADGRLTVRPSCPPGAAVVTHALAAHATATLVDLPHDEPAKEVQLPVLLDHLDSCLTGGEPELPYACYGNDYDLTLDARGRITRIRELPTP
ncbi:hypothetical protein ACFVUH_19815 [Kitasatospora sp. NPDC058032]|uniref:hypothetical protein n=1 Tax=Kitasatospora sp. NPDC058032 TaxID=3346307 RepID=UPI0036DEE615